MEHPLHVDHATRADARVALVTCAELPELDPDDQLVLAPLAQRGITATPTIWDDAGVDWSTFDLVVVRNPWDYHHRRDEFIAWAASVPALANPAPVIRWNTDKRYLRELAAAGVSVVPTQWIEPRDEWSAPATGSAYVIKPAVSAGSRDTGKYTAGEAELAGEHVRRLQAAGRTVMVQPYLPAVDTHGETALLYFADPATGELRFSHAICKGAMLTGPDTGTTDLYVAEVITPRTPSELERSTADAVLAAAPNGLLYARVDLIPGADGKPVLVELELTEPSVFLGFADGAADRFADAIAAALVRLG